MKSNKGLYIVICSLMALQWIVTIVFLILAPDIVPQHFEPRAPGGYDHYGSKYVWIGFPIVTTILGGWFLLWARVSKKGKDPSEERAVLLSLIPALIMWNLLWALFMSTAFVP